MKEETKKEVKRGHVEYDDHGAYWEVLEEISEFPQPVIQPLRMVRAYNPCRITAG